MIGFVLDASALVELTVGPDPARALQRRVATAQGAAPDVIDLEVLHAIRRMLRSGVLDVDAAGHAVSTAIAVPIARSPHRPLLGRVWELREILTAYDAAYVALAEQLAVPLLTCDGPLGRAHGHDAEVIVYPRS